MVIRERNMYFPGGNTYFFLRFMDRKRTRSVSEGQHRGSFSTNAKAEEVALAHASGSFPLARPSLYFE